MAWRDEGGDGTVWESTATSVREGGGEGHGPDGPVSGMIMGPKEREREREMGCAHLRVFFSLCHFSFSRENRKREKKRGKIK